MGSDKRKTLPKSNDNRSLAETFSDFFHKKVKAITHELDNLAAQEPQSNIPARISKLDSLSTVRNIPKLFDYGITTPEEVSKIILKSNSKYCCLDPMPTWLLKSNIDALAPSISMILNKSLVSGIVPKAFKHALIKPVLKKFNLDTEDLSSYRPVSNLPFLAKVLEKIVYSRLEDHLSSNKLLAKHQSAYRRGYSTETLLLRMSNDILTYLDQEILYF